MPAPQKFDRSKRVLTEAANRRHLNESTQIFLIKMPRKLRFISGKATRKNKRQQAVARRINMGDIEDINSEDSAAEISATPEELREALKSKAGKKKTEAVDLHERLLILAELRTACATSSAPMGWTRPSSRHAVLKSTHSISPFGPSGRCSPSPRPLRTWPSLKPASEQPSMRPWRRTSLLGVARESRKHWTRLLRGKAASFKGSQRKSPMFFLFR